MDTSSTRQRLPLVMSLCALLIAVGSAAAPSLAVQTKGVVATNSDKVDGLHAVKSTVPKRKMKGKLVATSGSTGKLPRAVIDSRALLPGANLPRGVTIRGAYATLGRTSGGDYHIASHDISFGYQLSSAPTVELLLAGDPPTTSCPGTPTAPEAAPGFLCIYESDSQAKRSSSYPMVGFGYAGGVAQPFGAHITTQSDDTSVGFFWSRGSWAVTSP